MNEGVRPGDMSGQGEAQPTGLFAREDVYRWELGEPRLRMPVEVFFQDGEVEWAPGGQRERQDAVLVPVATGAQLAEVAFSEVVRVLLSIDGVVPDECSGPEGVLVEPLPPTVADAAEVRWEVTPTFTLVQSGTEMVKLVAKPGSLAEYERAVELDGPATWRLARAFAAVGLLVADLTDAFVAAANATRERWGQLLEASGG